jgi:hypothetical protein
VGYTTKFNGSFKLDKPLTADQIAYLNRFSETRRMKRDTKIAETLSDGIRKAVRLPIGKEAGFFVGGAGFCGQERDNSILEYNDPPEGQPGLWCQWVTNTNANDVTLGWRPDSIAEEGREIGWNGGEKFYNYVEWLVYIIENFLKPWGYILNGEVEWQGEERSDIGLLVVRNNVVSTRLGEVVYVTPVLAPTVSQSVKIAKRQKAKIQELLNPKAAKKAPAKKVPAKKKALKKATKVKKASTKRGARPSGNARIVAMKAKKR